MPIYCCCITELKFSMLDMYIGLTSTIWMAFSRNALLILRMSCCKVNTRPLLLDAELRSGLTPHELPEEGIDVLNPRTGRGWAALKMKAVFLACFRSAQQQQRCVPSAGPSSEPKESCCFCPVAHYHSRRMGWMWRMGRKRGDESQKEDGKEHRTRSQLGQEDQWHRSPWHQTSRERLQPVSLSVYLAGATQDIIQTCLALSAANGKQCCKISKRSEMKNWTSTYWCLWNTLLLLQECWREAMGNFHTRLLSTEK